jgi:hypothetical protein
LQLVLPHIFTFYPLSSRIIAKSSKLGGYAAGPSDFFIKGKCSETASDNDRSIF